LIDIVIADYLQHFSEIIAMSLQLKYGEKKPSSSGATKSGLNGGAGWAACCYWAQAEGLCL